jgi:hypothetical protein
MPPLESKLADGIGEALDLARVGGKTIRINAVFGKRVTKFSGQKFWARFVIENRVSQPKLKEVGAALSRKKRKFPGKGAKFFQVFGSFGAFFEIIGLLFRAWEERGNGAFNLANIDAKHKDALREREMDFDPFQKAESGGWIAPVEIVDDNAHPAGLIISKQLLNSVTKEGSNMIGGQATAKIFLVPRLRLLVDRVKRILKLETGFTTDTKWRRLELKAEFVNRAKKTFGNHGPPSFENLLYLLVFGKLTADFLEEGDHRGDFVLVPPSLEPNGEHIFNLDAARQPFEFISFRADGAFAGEGVLYLTEETGFAGTPVAVNSKD